MKPNDENGTKPPSERPMRVLVIAGSNRRQFSCPGVDSKSRALMLRMAERLPPEWEIDYEDLGNVYGRAKIQSCNGCVSTSMALCVWPCNCYEKQNADEPDLMWDLDMYSRLELADAWAIIGPINWYAPSTTLKLMFDRLVCMNGGNPREELIDHKDPEKAMALEKSQAWRELTSNHLEGRTAGFFCYGDEGGDEMTSDGYPITLRHRTYFDPADEPFGNERDAYRPLVWQSRFSGIEVPDALWAHATTGKGKPFADDQAEDMVQDQAFLNAFDGWTERFAAFVRNKGKAEQPSFRAFGYEAPGHRIADAKLKWRSIRIGLGLPRAESSPAHQQQQDLTDDQTLHTKRSEGEKLRG